MMAAGDIPEGTRMGIGLDLALRHGVLALVTHHEDSGLVDWEILSQWSLRRAPTRRGPSSVVKYYHTKILQVLRPVLRDHPGLPVGIDWDPREAYWGQRTPAVWKAMVVGYLYRALLTMGAKPLVIPPATVRGCLGLGQRTKKAVVYQAFNRLPIRLTRALPCSLDDVADAIILGYLSQELLDGKTAPAAGRTVTSRVSRRKASG